MLKSLIIILMLLGSAAFASIPDVKEGDVIYITAFQKGHPECVRETPTLMRCPTNALNELLPGQTREDYLEAEVVRELRYIESNPDCVEEDTNTLRCPIE